MFGPVASRTLTQELLTPLRRGLVGDHDDVDVGSASLVHDELEKYGTDSSQELT